MKGPCRTFMKALARAVMTDQRGATAVEYGLILALIVIAMIGAVMEVASRNTAIWSNVSTAVVKAGP